MFVRLRAHQSRAGVLMSRSRTSKPLTEPVRTPTSGPGYSAQSFRRTPGSVLASSNPCGVVGHLEAATGKHKSPVAASSSTAENGVDIAPLPFDGEVADAV